MFYVFKASFNLPKSAVFSIWILKRSVAFFQDLKDHFRQVGEVAFTKCHREKIGEGYFHYFDCFLHLKQLMSSFDCHFFNGLLHQRYNDKNFFKLYSSIYHLDL